MTTYCQLTLCAINISEWDGKVVLWFQALPIKEVCVSPSITTRCLLTVGCRSTQPLPLYHHGHTDTSAAVPEWHWWQEGARRSCQTGEKLTPFITRSFKQTWSQKPHGHQKTPTEKSSWCPPACDAWLEAAHLLAKVWLPHQGSQCEAFWQHNVRLHDIRKDKCQMGYLLQHALKTKTAGEIHYHLPIHYFLHCGSFKRQISGSKGRQRESTSDRSFVKKWISFGSHFHPSHLNSSVPCCSLSPEGWIVSASLLWGGSPPLTEISQSVCRHHHRDTQARLTLMAAFVTAQDISGLVLNCSAIIEWWTQRNGTGLANSARQLVCRTSK